MTVVLSKCGATADNDHDGDDQEGDDDGHGSHHHDGDLHPRGVDNHHIGQAEKAAVSDQE